MYICFICSQLLLVLEAAVIWTGNGAYLTAYARPDTNARNIGIMWAMLQSSLIIGSIFMFIILHHGAIVDSYHVLYTVFSIVCVVGLGVLFLLPKVEIGPIDSQVLREEREHFDDEDIEPSYSDNEPISIRVRRESSSGLSDDGSVGFWADFARTFALMKTRKMILLSVVFVFSGLELTFFSGVYSACLAGTKLLGESSGLIVAFCVLFIGCGQILGGLVFGICSQRFVQGKRFPVIILGFFVHLLAFFLIVINIPMEAPIHPTFSSAWMNPNVILAVFCGFLLGFADSCWNTQIYSLLGEIYYRNSSPAFAIFKFYQSLAACISFFYGSIFLLHIQLMLLAVAGSVATWAFFTIEKEVSGHASSPIE